MKYLKQIKNKSYLFALFFYILEIEKVFATDYQPLAPIPTLVKTSGKTDLSTYLPGVFNLAISIAVALAFVMIVVGGIMYAVSDSLSEKSEGRKYVTNAIGGLLIAIGAYTIIYTINPQMLNFSLDVFRPASQAPTTGTGGLTSTPSANGTGCRGTSCIYSYVNSSRTTVSYMNCFNCKTYSSYSTLNFKTKLVDGKTVQINDNLATRLVGLQSISNTPAFTITESWPPTVNHRDQLQYQGASVDISIANPTASSITNFITNSKSKGLSATYEVANSNTRDTYIRAGVPAGSIIVVPYITGEHFSVK